MKLKKLGLRLLSAVCACVLLFSSGILSACEETPTTQTPPPSQTKIVYSVKILEESGYGKKGVKVEWYNDQDVLIANATTNSSGNAKSSEILAEDYYIKLNGILSEGFTYEQDEKGYYIAKATADTPSLTIQINKDAKVPTYSSTSTGEQGSPYKAIGESKWVLKSNIGWSEIFFIWDPYDKSTAENDAESVEAATGVYKISVQGANATITQYNGGWNAFKQVQSPDSMEVIVQRAVAKTPHYFGILVTDADANACIFAIEYVEDYIEKPTQTTEILPREIDKVKNFQTPTGNVENVKIDGTHTATYNEADGFYHLDIAGSPVLMLDIKGKIAWYVDEFGNPTVDQNNQPTLYHPITQIDIKGGFSYIFDLTPENEREDLTKPTIMHDYRMFIRGFINYNSSASTSITPGHGVENEAPAMNERFGEFYEKYANEDGLVPVTQELATFLKLVMNKLNFSYPGMRRDSAWLYACRYYE